MSKASQKARAKRIKMRPTTLDKVRRDVACERQKRDGSVIPFDGVI